MTILIPSGKGYECKDCEFNTKDIFIFLDHCDICFSWGLRLSNRYTVDLFSVLNELNNCLQRKDSGSALDLIQHLTLSLVNASEGERSFHKFVNESITAELATDMVQNIEEMLKNNDKHKENE